MAEPISVNSQKTEAPNSLQAPSKYFQPKPHDGGRDAGVSTKNPHRSVVHELEEPNNRFNLFAEK